MRSATSPARSTQFLTRAKKSSISEDWEQQFSQIDSINQNENPLARDRRREFQASLQLVYFTFSRWREAVVNLQRKREQMEQLACRWHQQHCMRRVLDAWQDRVLEAHQRFRQWEIALGFNDRACTRRYFMRWTWAWRLRLEIDRRRAVILLRLSCCCFGRWAKFVKLQRISRVRFENVQRKNLRQALQKFQRRIRKLKADRIVWARAISHCDKTLQATMFDAWGAHVLLSSTYLASLRRAKIASLKSGIRRWTRFLHCRRRSAHQQLQADYLRYRSAVKFAFSRWCQYQDTLRRRRGFWVSAEKHHNTVLLRQALHGWHRYRHACVDKRNQYAKACIWCRSRAVASVFGRWRGLARLNALSHKVATASRARQAQSVLASWHDWAERSRVHRWKFCSVRSRYERITLTRAWAYWREVMRRTTTLSSLLCRRQQRILTQYVMAWRDAARVSRRHRCLIEGERTKSSRGTLRLSLKAWADITLRRRCCNQLVKLFRKKAQRRFLRHSLRWLRIAVRCSERQRRMEQEVMRRAFFKCRSYSTARKSKQACNRLASEYFFSTQCSSAIRKWILACRAQRNYRSAMLTALKHHYDGIVRRALHGWYLSARRLRRRAEMLAARQQQRDRRYSRSVLWAWYVFAQAQRRRELQDRTARNQHINRQYRVIWAAWIQFTSCQRYFRRRMLAAVASHERHCSSQMFSVWFRAARRLRELRTREQEVREILLGRRLSSTVALWRQTHRKRTDSRRRLAMAATFYNETLLCRALLMWQAFWYAGAVQRDRQCFVVTGLMRKRLQSAMKTWRRRCSAHKSSREAQKSADSHHHLVLVHRGVQRWRQHYTCRKKNRSKHVVATSHYRRCLLQNVLKLWGRYATRQHALKTQLRRIFRREAQFALRQVFDVWRQYRRTSTLRRIADGFCRRAICRKVWRHWTAHCKFMTKINKSTLVTGQLLRGNALRMTFAAWQTYISLRYRHQDALDVADAHRRNSQCRTGVRRWKAFHDRLERAEAALVFASSQRKRSAFRLWRSYMKRVDEKERQWQHAGEWRRHRLLSQHLAMWTATTRQFTQGRVRRSEAHFNRMLIKKVWGRWRHLKEWARIAAAIHSRRMAACTRVAWNQWLQYLTAQAGRRQQVSKASTFHRLTQQSQAWHAWQEYMTYRHLKYRQYDRAHEHYDTLLYRRHFKAWTRFAVYQCKRHDRLMLAAEHVDRARLHSTLRRWISFWKYCAGQRQQERDFRSRIVCLRLSRSIAKWQEETQSAAKKRQALQIGSEHYRHRSLATALACFRHQKEQRQSARRQQAQASAFLRTQRLGELFRRWLCYHSWRKRNLRLVRLFRESRKDDYFYRWKSFWSDKKVKAAMALKARTSHCKRMEYRCFQRWLDDTRDRRLKQRANEFNANRMQRQFFVRWRRRVRVVQQMRRLLRSQVSFRVEVHFAAWQRFVSARKHQMKRFERATSFMNRSRMEKHWCKWSLFIASQREQRAVVKKAERFRQRFTTWRLFHAWRSRTNYWNRKRVLGSAAIQASRYRWLTRIVGAWASWHRDRRALRSLQTQFAAHLSRERTRQTVLRLAALVNERRAVTTQRARADNHRKQQTRAACWLQWRQWHHHAKSRRSLAALADMRFRQSLSRRCFAALTEWLGHTRATRARLGAFRRRYFATVVERCFGRWCRVSALRRELRRMIHQRDSSRRRELLLQWRSNAVRVATQRTQREVADSHYRGRLVTRCFQHWESVSTDQWVADRLVQLHTTGRQLRMASRGVQRWQEAVRERRRARLAMVLRAWHLAVDGTRVSNR